MQRRMWRRGPDGEILPANPQEEAAGSGEETPGTAPGGRPRARLGLALRLGFRDVYDHLGAVLLMSLLWSFLAGSAALGGHALVLALAARLPGALPALLAAGGAVAGLTLVGGPLLAGLFRYARNAAARQEPEVFDLAWGFRRCFGRSALLAAIQAAGTVLLGSNLYFYALSRHPLLVVLAGVFGYGLAFWLLMSLYQWALLSEQELPVRRVLGKSALLVLDNLGYSLLLGFAILLLSTLLWLTMVGGALLWAGALSILLTQATRELLRKYGVLPPDPTLDPIADESHDTRGRGWHE